MLLISRQYITNNISEPYIMWLLCHIYLICYQ